MYMAYSLMTTIDDVRKTINFLMTKEVTEIKVQN